jgi:hypothetical protein
MGDCAGRRRDASRTGTRIGLRVARRVARPSRVEPRARRVSPVLYVGARDNPIHADRSQRQGGRAEERGQQRERRLVSRAAIDLLFPSGGRVSTRPVEPHRGGRCIRRLSRLRRLRTAVLLTVSRQMSGRSHGPRTNGARVSRSRRRPFTRLASDGVHVRPAPARSCGRA